MEDERKIPAAGEGGNAMNVEWEEDLFRLMRRCGHILFQKEAKRSSQGQIMHILYRHGEIGQKELQEILQIQPGSISEILSKLENKGFLRRDKDDEDKRRIIVRITREGRLHAEEFHRARSRNMFAALSPEQQEELKKLLKLLIENWEGAKS